MTPSICCFSRVCDSVPIEDHLRDQCNQEVCRSTTTLRLSHKVYIKYATLGGHLWLYINPSLANHDGSSLPAISHHGITLWGESMNNISQCVWRREQVVQPAVQLPPVKNVVISHDWPMGDMNSTMMTIGPCSSRDITNESALLVAVPWSV